MSSTVTKSVPQQFPFLDLKAQFASIRTEAESAVLRILDSQHFIMGPEVEALEKEISAYLGTKYALGCASGSDALLLALMALGVGPGDEVITVPFTFVATAGAIARLHATPVFIDIDPATYNLDPAQLERAITARTKAIIPVHLFGLAADMERILSVAAAQEVAVVEDAAQAIGSRYKGKIVGTMGVFRSSCSALLIVPNQGSGRNGLKEPGCAGRKPRLHNADVNLDSELSEVRKPPWYGSSLPSTMRKVSYHLANLRTTRIRGLKA